MDSFRALVLQQHEGEVDAAVTQVPTADLPDDSVTVRVAYSSLNYKDGLALLGKARVVRTYPMVPGVDLVGTVESSTSDQWRPGDRVICTGWGMGETHWGGYGELARLKPEWLVALPDGLTPEGAMGIGTAGFTAMLAVMALEHRGLTPGGGEVVVTGAAGGVGGMAVALLAALGYTVVASTGRRELDGYLRDLGASEIVDRDLLAASSQRPLETARWAGAVDAVGGDTLAGLLRTMRPHATVAATGNAGGNDLHTTVLPFILRGVDLAGIDSNYCPIEMRREAWNRLARDLPASTLDRMTQTVPLEDLLARAPQILAGQVRGRVVVQV